MKPSEYLPLYIGQQIELDQSRFIDKQEDRTVTLSGFAAGEFYIREFDLWYKPELGYGNKPIDKLVLRKWESATEEDMEGWKFFSTPVPEGVDPLLMARIHWAKKLTYMRSHGFDCDGLIEAGCAIEKK